MDYYFEERYHLLDDHTPLSVYSNKNFSYRAHWHTEVEVCIVTKGSFILSINDDRRKLAVGDMAICLSGDIHYYEKGEEDTEVLILVFKPEFFGLAPNWPEHNMFITPFIYGNTIDSSVTALFIEQMKKIYNEKENKQPQYELLIKGLLYEFCALLLRYIPTSQKEGQKAGDSTLLTMRQILDYIEGHYTESLSLKSLAAKFNVDHYNLSKRFNVMTGNNLKTHINMLRISKAEEQIINTDDTMLSIALECGYDSIRTFNRTFKQLRGCTPTSLRK